MTSPQEEKKILTEIDHYLKSKKVQLRGPESADKVYKDECVYCFDTPFVPDGLFISLIDFVGVCSKHIDQYVQKTSNQIFLNIHKYKLPKEESEEPKDKVQRLCIKDTQDQIGSRHTLHFYPYLDTPIQISQHLDEVLREICDLIIAHVSAEIQQRLQSGISAWDGEERPISKAADELVQVQYEGPPIPYEGWVCSVPDCGLRENLWLNLSDGIICCGRYAPMGGQNGNGHAKKHYEETGFPLVVKLGTIENGDGDIYSYSEDSAVRDPKLKEHLAHFGLQIDNFTKTEKTTLELELDTNLKHEFSAIQEEGATLKNVYGPGFTGLINLGSSCYINSALQMLYNVPDFQQMYGQNAKSILAEPPPVKTYENFNCQLAKVVGAMLSGEYSKEGAQEENGIRPTIFRRLAGQGHVEFSTAKQQDAEEYIRHLFDKIDQNVEGDVNPVNAFRFLLVNRFEDMQSSCVRYTSREDTILSVPVPSRDTWRRSSIIVDGTSVPRAVVSLCDCIQAAFGEEFIDGYTSPVTKQRGTAKQQSRMGSFPDFLIIQIRRFAANDNFEVKKLEVDVEISEQIDLAIFQSDGKLQPGEQPLPDDDDQTMPPAIGIRQVGPQLNQEIISTLMDMGFAENAAKKATFLSKNSLDAATNWALEHMGDSDFNEPHPALQKQQQAASSTSAKNQNSSAEKQDKINQIAEFGFPVYKAKFALEHNGWDTGVAADWLFNHGDEVPPEPTPSALVEEEDTATPKVRPAKEVRTGPGKYHLQAFISHMGSSPHSGHYVAHVRRDDGTWYIFNDEKVAISQNPPKSLGYLYLYQRI